MSEGHPAMTQVEQLEKKLADVSADLAREASGFSEYAANDKFCAKRTMSLSVMRNQFETLQTTLRLLTRANRRIQAD